MAGKRQINHAWNEAKTVRGKNPDTWWRDSTFILIGTRGQDICPTIYW